MATETTETTTNSPPEFTSLYRVASIPLVASSLDTIHSTLSTNPYTKSPYSTATGLAYSAWGYTSPIQVRLAPITTRADGYANKGLDAVESRYPYPFQAKPEEIEEFVRERRQSLIDTTNKTYDEKVKSPALSVAKGVDQRFSPIVDYFEVQVNKLNSEGAAVPSDAEYQYQRVLAISKNLTDNIYVYSNEHLKQLQAQNTLVQRATATAQSISDLATSSVANAQSRIHALSDTMLSELQKVQASTAALPKTLQDSFPDLTSTISDLRDIVLAKDVPLNEKANLVGQEVKERVNPVLEEAKQKLKELVGFAVKKKDEAEDTAAAALSETKAKVNGVVNRTANGTTNGTH